MCSLNVTTANMSLSIWVVSMFPVDLK
jgi:hypothetical protein